MDQESTGKLGGINTMPKSKAPHGGQEEGKEQKNGETTLIMRFHICNAAQAAFFGIR